MSYPRYHSDQKAADADLLTRVGIALTLKSPRHARALDVEVDHGTVTLRGPISSQADRRAVNAVVSHLAGVRQVNDELYVAERFRKSPWPLHRLRAWQAAMLQRSPQLPSLALTNRPASLLIAAALLLASGCGETTAKRAETFPVEGAITFKGQPISGAFVALHPKSPRPDVPPPRASVGPDGSIKVSTYDAGDGAPEGEYVLTVEWYKLVKQGADVVAGPNVIPPKYASPKTSDLVVSVAAKPNKLPPIKL